MLVTRSHTIWEHTGQKLNEASMKTALDDTNTPACKTVCPLVFVRAFVGSFVFDVRLVADRDVCVFQNHAIIFDRMENCTGCILPKLVILPLLLCIAARPLVGVVLFALPRGILERRPSG